MDLDGYSVVVSLLPNNCQMVTLGILINFLSLNLLIYKMGVIIVSTS